MKKHGRLILIFATALFSALFFTLAASAEIIGDHIEYTYNEKVIVNNDWTLDTETGLLTITSLEESNWNECGTGQSSYDKYGGWSKYKDQIKKVVLVGHFNKISNNAFNGCKNLTEIVIPDNISQIDYGAFKGCSTLHTVSLQNYMRIEGMADLRNITSLSGSTFAGTRIETVFVSSNDNFTIEEDVFPETVTAFYGEEGSAAHTYATENGIDFSPKRHYVNLDIMLEGKLFQSLSIAFGSKLIDFGMSSNGSAVCIFEDAECTKIYDNTQYITDDTVLYAGEMLSFAGWSVRVSEYKGLRAIFDFNIGSVDSFEGAEILQVGAIAGINEYALNDFTVDTEGVQKLILFENGEKVGQTLGVAKNGIVSFAVSAVGFEGSEEETADRALENIVFRGFMKIMDNATGKEIYLYTDAVGSTLRQVSLGYLNSEEGKRLSSEEREFVSEAVEITAGKGEDVRYNKEELMELLTEIYNDNGKLLVGEEIAPKDTAADVIASYMEASGEAPSIIGMDLACYGVQLMTTTESYRTEFLKSLIDYCRDGGIITASSHFQNPTRNWTSGGLCRGYLGKESMWEDLLTEGTVLNREFKRELNVDAAFLRELSNNDIPILWRPFHEMNGSWFWWCIKQENGYLVDARNFQEMWKYVYEYYEEELGLTNLIWVYSPNNDTGTLVDVEYCYPGDEYVDMTGLDWYSSGDYEIASEEGAYLRMMDYGMPTALTEYGGSNGELDSLETWEDLQKMYADGMKLTYILTWTSKHTFHQAGKCDEFMAKPDILNVTEVWAMFKAKEIK